MAATVDIGSRNYIYDADVVLTIGGTIVSGQPISNVVDGKKRTYGAMITTFQLDFDLITARKINRVYIKSNATLANISIISADNAGFTTNAKTHTQTVIINTGLYRYVSIDATFDGLNKRYWRISTTTVQSGTQWQIYDVFLFEFLSAMDASTSEDDLPSNLEFHSSEPVAQGYYLASGAYVQPRIEQKYAPVIPFDKIAKSFYDTLYSYYELGGVTIGGASGTNPDGEVTLFLMPDYFRERILQCVITDFNLEIDQDGIHTDPPRFSGNIRFVQSK